MPSLTAQQKWPTRPGVDFLQLIAPTGASVIGGIDSTGTRYGSMLSVSMTATTENTTTLILNPFDSAQTTPVLILNGSNMNLAMSFTAAPIVFVPPYFDRTEDEGSFDADNGVDGLVVGGTTDGDVTEAGVTLPSDSTAGVNLINGAQDAGFLLQAGVITATGSVNLSGKLTSYNGIVTSNGGVPVAVAGPAKLTAQSSAKVAQLVFATGTVPGAGLYKVSYVATVTHADTTSLILGGAAGFQLIFTNANGDSVIKTSNPTTPNISSVNSTGTMISGTILAYAVANSNLQYNFGYTAGTGDFRYDLAIFVEFLGA